MHPPRLLLAPLLGLAVQAQTPSPELRTYLKVDAPLVAIVHVRVVDGTGAPTRQDQTLVLRGGRI